WAIAGRNAKKLGALRTTLTTAPDVLVADADDDAATDRLVAQTRVILTTAGPFARYGEAIVRSCATRGVDYVDITGETPWVRRLIDRYQTKAVNSGAKIVPFCGFDSVPSDLGVHLLVEHFRSLGRQTRDVRAFQRARGGVNGGTIASMTNMLASADRNVFDDPLLLNPDEYRSSDEALDNRDPVMPHYDPDLKRWVAPFFMAPINTRVVRRSHALSSQWQRPYGDRFQYQEYWDLGASAGYAGVAAATFGMGFFQSMMRLPGVGRAIEAIAPSPGTGPSEETMDNGFYECRLVGTADDGSKAWAFIAGKGDPGNRATVTFVCECAIALATQRDRLPGGADRAGLLTPATAFGDVLVERLRSAGVTLTCPTTP
ncbi:MAG TPA: saccharopine dehydrogenase NADP-binding domain-containing protein, partial [Pseudomonadales bacterium]